MTWEPRIAMTAAEAVVDFPATNDHIVEQRKAIEDAAWPAARRLVLTSEDLGGYVPQHAKDDLASKLEQGLERTARFGFREAKREIAALREGRAVTAAVALPEDAGEYGELALQGLDGIRRLIRQRSHEATLLVADAVTEAGKTPGLTTTEREVLLTKAARRALHNNVLELVGETLNMGRTAGALSLPVPPEFALRSEQLDKRTCDPCSRLHGEIAIVGSAEYFALLPPTGCLGGGRCRGLMVFGQGPVDLRLPEAA